MAVILALAVGGTPGLSGQPHDWKHSPIEHVTHLRSSPALAEPHSVCHGEPYTDATVLDVESERSLTRVLVVDDEEPIRSTLIEAFELEGYAVRAASNGVEAFDVMRRFRPSAIVLDLMMPVMNGWEFLEQCRSDAACSDTPVLVISAYSKLPQEAARLGVKACIAKPFDLEVLLGAVDRLVRAAA
jgi:two-component system, OmpR family, response regulator